MKTVTFFMGKEYNSGGQLAVSSLPLKELFLDQLFSAAALPPTWFHAERREELCGDQMLRSYHAVANRTGCKVPALEATKILETVTDGVISTQTLSSALRRVCPAGSSTEVQWS